VVINQRTSSHDKEDHYLFLGLLIFAAAAPAAPQKTPPQKPVKTRPQKRPRASAASVPPRHPV